MASPTPGQYTLVAAPATEPVTLTELKAKVKVTSTDQDTELTTAITAARKYVENWTHRTLITQAWKFIADEFPAGIIELEKTPITSITSVQYKDTAGATQTWSSSYWQSSVGETWGRVAPIFGQTWPSTATGTFDSVIVTFGCGFGAASAVPEDIKDAIMIIASDRNFLRTMHVTGTIISEVPRGVHDMLAPYRDWRFA